MTTLLNEPSVGLPLLDINPGVTQPIGRPVPSSADTGEPSRVRRDQFSNEPRAQAFATNATHFHGFTRRTPGPRTPDAAAVTDFVLHPAYERYVRAAICGAHLFLIGPPGSGKSMFAEWLAHEMGLAFYPVSFDGQTQTEDLQSKPVQGEDGIWRDMPSPLVYAYEHGGVVRLDEVPSLKAPIAQVLHPFLNRDTFVLKTGSGERTISPHEDFRAVLTGNHWSYTAGNYELGEPLCDRVLFVQAQYLPAEAEFELLRHDAPSVPPGSISDLLDFANTIRQATILNPDTNRYCPTTRVLRKLVSLMEYSNFTFDEAVEDCLINRLRIRHRDEYPSVIRIMRAKLSLENWNAFPDQIDQP